MLIAVQAALGVVLVGGATATVRSFLGIVLRSPGFVAEGLFDLRVNHGTDAGRSALLEARIRSALETGVLDSSASRGFAYLRVRGVMEAVRGVSGVQAAGAVHRLPVGQLASPRVSLSRADCCESSAPEARQRRARRAQQRVHD